MSTANTKNTKNRRREAAIGDITHCMRCNFFRKILNYLSYIGSFSELFEWREIDILSFGWSHFTAMCIQPQVSSIGWLEIKLLAQFQFQVLRRLLRGLEARVPIVGVAWFYGYTVVTKRVSSFASAYTMKNMKLSTCPRSVHTLTALYCGSNNFQYAGESGRNRQILTEHSQT